MRVEVQINNSVDREKVKEEGKDRVGREVDTKHYSFGSKRSTRQSKRVKTLNNN
jgi:hypothetical protein